MVSFAGTIAPMPATLSNPGGRGCKHRFGLWIVLKKHKKQKASRYFFWRLSAFWKDWRLRIRDIMPYKDAGFMVPVASTITLMPGTSFDPTYRCVDLIWRQGRRRGILILEAI